MEPTAYFHHRRGGWARWYWPDATKVEVFREGEWVERPLFLDLNEDPDWEDVDEADVTVPT